MREEEGEKGREGKSTLLYACVPCQFLFPCTIKIKKFLQTSSFQETSGKIGSNFTNEHERH